jgi:RHS repeat-associated protein
VESLESPHAATDDTGAERIGYVFAGEHPLLRYDTATNEPTYYLEDGVGTVIGLVGDDAATETSAIHYDGFGNELSTTGALATLPTASNGDFRFQGMWLDGGTGLYYVRARVYDQEAGRFLSRDPIDRGRRDPSAYAPFGFGANAPTRFRDPSGLTTLGETSVSISISRTLNGTAVGRVTVTTARVTFEIARIELHHTLPQMALRALLGEAGTAAAAAEAQLTYRLPVFLHRIFTELLRQELVSAGFPTGSAALVEYFRRNPNSVNTFFDILRRVTIAFDQRYGTEMYHYLRYALASAGF